MELGERLLRLQEEWHEATVSDGFFGGQSKTRPLADIAAEYESGLRELLG